MPDDATRSPTRATGALRLVRRLFIYAAIFSCYVNLLMLAGPVYMLQIYDRVLGSRSVETLVALSLLVFVLFAAMGALDFARGALLSRAGARLETRLQGPVFDLSLTAARQGFPGPDQPLKDLRTVSRFIGSPAVPAAFDAPWTPVYLAVVFFMHPALGLVASAGLVLLVVIALVTRRLSRAALQEAAARAAEADRTVAEALRGVVAADAMGMRRTLRERWRESSLGALDRSLGASDVVFGAGAVSRAARLFLQSAMLGVGAWLAIRGETSAGVMIAASIIASRALAPIEGVTANWRNYADAAAAWRRLSAVLATRAGERRKTRLPRPHGAIQATGLYLKPASAPRPVVREVSFRLEPGETLCIVGASGSGKSTLARALAGVENVIAGEIRLDGAKLADWDPDDLGAAIGYLPQDVELFAGTAAENIARFDPQRSDESVVAAAEAAGAHDMILGFDNGYDCLIGEGGRRLSVGQRQRLGLARALYRDPALVVLDEPNSNLDAEGDAAFAAAVARLRSRAVTVVIVAHRPGAIALADKLLVLVNGSMAAFGPRDDVMRRMTAGRVEGPDAHRLANAPREEAAEAR